MIPFAFVVSISRPFVLMGKHAQKGRMGRMGKDGKRVNDIERQDATSMQSSVVADKAEKFKPTSLRIYLSEEEVRMLNMICVRTELGQTELATKLTKAALRALVESDEPLTLPIRFSLLEPESRGLILNESSKKK